MKEKISNSDIGMLISLAVGILAGLIVGVALSAAGKGIAIGSYNGCNNNVPEING